MSTFTCRSGGCSNFALPAFSLNLFLTVTILTVLWFLRHSNMSAMTSGSWNSRKILLRSFNPVPFLPPFSSSFLASCSFTSARAEPLGGPNFAFTTSSESSMLKPAARSTSLRPLLSTVQAALSSPCRSQTSSMVLAVFMEVTSCGERKRVSQGRARTVPFFGSPRPSLFARTASFRPSKPFRSHSTLPAAVPLRSLYPFGFPTAEPFRLRRGRGAKLFSRRRRSPAP
jgi:hypothetical protein